MPPAPPPRAPLIREVNRLLILQNLGLNAFLTLGFLWAATQGHPSLVDALLVLVAFVGARNAGHAFNQIVDRDLDARNPRTRDRPLVTGSLSVRFAGALVAGNLVVVLVAAWLLNPLVLLLAPLALALVLGYSYTKRYTPFTTVILGSVEAMVPAGVYLALVEGLPPAAWAGIGGVLLFGTAFESVHSLQDLDADRESGIHSLPRSLGERRTVPLVAGLLAASLVFLLLFGTLASLGLPFDLALLAMAAVAAWEIRGLSTRSVPLRTLFRAHFAMGLAFLLGVWASYIPGVHLVP